MSTQLSHYEILGIDHSADPKEVAAAYKSAIGVFRPDIDSQPNMERFRALVSGAYAVLSDPDARRAYDAGRNGDTASTTAGANDSSDWVVRVCERCSSRSAFLRIVRFERFLFLWGSESAAIVCPSCKDRVAIRTAMISMSAWLGNVRRIIEAIINAYEGGFVGRIRNAPLLRDLGLAFLHHGYHDEAKTVLEDSETMFHSPYIASLLRLPLLTTATRLKNRRRSIKLLLVLIIAVFSVVSFVIFLIVKDIAKFFAHELVKLLHSL